MKIDFAGEGFDSTVAAAGRLGLRVVGHAPMVNAAEEALAKALAVPYASMEHLHGYMEKLIGLPDDWFGWRIPHPEHDTAAWMRPGYRVAQQPLRELVAATRRAGVWNTPTLLVLESLCRNWRESGQEPGELGKMWASAAKPICQSLAINAQIVKALYDGGAGLLAGTDQVDPLVRTAPGFALHRELELLVEVGLPPYAALATATRNPAEFFGTLDSAGTVAVSKRADLLLLAANPLRDISATRSIAGVMVKGQWLSRDAIEARLDSVRTLKRFDLAEVRRAEWRPGH